MPVRPENKSRYPKPKDWKVIRERILARASRGPDNWATCEHCGAPNHCWVERTAWEADSWELCQPSDGGVYVVLTIAHLDHTPENCDDENLRALCQLCHNRYDGPTRAAGKLERARLKRASADLFQPEGSTS
jgi:5-methylcytosine-specific restriction endonuclease McrA